MQVWRRHFAPAPLFLTVLLLAIAAPARAGDGAIQWRTLQIPGVSVHYPKHLEGFARRALATYVDARAHLQPLFTYQPKLLHITIDDYADNANGYATPIFFDHVHLQAYPPAADSDLADHGDWLRALLFHEFSHVLHLGDTSGMPWLVNKVFGPRYFPNLLLPRFFLEGLATHVETRHTGGDAAMADHGGRVDSPSFLAYLRAASLDGTWPDLDHLSGPPLIWPRGNAWYVYGSLLLDDIAKQYGHASIRHFSSEIGGRFIPYGVQGVSRSVWQHSLTRLWHDATQRFSARVRAEVQQANGVDLGENPSQSAAIVLASTGDGSRLTTNGEHRGRVRWSGDGTWALWPRQPADSPRRIEFIRKRDLQSGSGSAAITPSVLFTCAYDCDEPLVTPDGKWLLFTEARRFHRLYLFSELIAVPLGPEGAVSGPAIALSHGARARSISLDAQANSIVYVAVRDAQTEIRRLDLKRAIAQAQTDKTDDLSELLLAPAPIGQTLDCPVVAGDGKLYWTLGVGGERRLFSAPYDGQPIKNPQALQTATARGDRLRRAKIGDRVTWIADLHAFFRNGQPRLGGLIQTGLYRDAAELDLATGIWQLRTQTLTGIASAAVDASATLTIRHHGNGLEVYLAPALADLVALPGAATEAEIPSVADLAYSPKNVEVSSAPYRMRRQHMPFTWSPLYSSTAILNDFATSNYIGAQWLQQDPLNFVTTTTTGQIRLDGTQLVLLASSRITRWEPTWSGDFALQDGASVGRNGFSAFYLPTRRIGGRFGGGWSVADLRSAWRIDGGARLVYSTLKNLDFRSRFPYDPGGPPPLEPWTGLENSLDFGGGWTFAQSFPTSIATERLHRISARVSWSDRGLSGDRRRFAADLATAHHFPLGHRAVLATSANVSLVPVAPDSTPAFYVHGVQPLDPWAILGVGAGQGAIVRGAGAAAEHLAGNGLAWGSVQLNLPVADIGQGPDLLPIYAGRLSWVGFCDVASSFWQTSDRRFGGGALASVGTELRLDYSVGYAASASVRLGFAHAFGEFGNTAGYLQIGL